MAGLLSAIRGTRFHMRLNRQGRPLEEGTGSNTAIGFNFVSNEAKKTHQRQPDHPRHHLFT
jgi:hypothetical protein